jgi:hypothetical protein
MQSISNRQSSSLPHLKLVSCHKIVPQDALKAAFNVDMIVAAGKAHGEVE